MNGAKKNLAIVYAVLRQGMSVAGAAEKCGVSRQWVYKLIDRYHESGDAGLVPGSRAPHASSQRLPDELVDRIVAIRKELTNAGHDAGPRSIMNALEDEGLRIPSDSTIRRVLHQAGLVTPEPRKRPKSSFLRFEADLPNECWQADITYWYLADDVTRIEILDFLDDHSRYLLGIQARMLWTGTQVTAYMQELIDTFGAPASTLTDNGMVFTARYTSRPGARNGFEKLLDAHRIKQKNGRPGHPQTQGKIERFHQTLKKYLKAQPRPETLGELNELLARFRCYYNTKRRHNAIGRRTPQDAYTASDKATPDTDAADELRTRTDVIDSSGKLTLRYAGRLRHLGVGRAYRGRPVLMIIHNRHVTVSDAASAEIYAEYMIDETKNYQKPIRHTRAQTPASSEQKIDEQDT